MIFQIKIIRIKKIVVNRPEDRYQQVLSKVKKRKNSYKYHFSKCSKTVINYNITTSITPTTTTMLKIANKKMKNKKITIKIIKRTIMTKKEIKKILLKKNQRIKTIIIITQKLKNKILIVIYMKNELKIQ